MCLKDLSRAKCQVLQRGIFLNQGLSRFEESPWVFPGILGTVEHREAIVNVCTFP